MKNKPNYVMFMKLLLPIIGGLFLLGTIITIIGYFTQKNTLSEYKTTGITIPATVISKSSFSAKVSKKSKTTKYMVQLSFVLNGVPGETYSTQYIGEKDLEALKEGEIVDLVYLPKTEYIANNKATFIKPVILKNFMESAFNGLVRYIYFGVAFLILGIGFFIPMFLKKKTT